MKTAREALRAAYRRLERRGFPRTPTHPKSADLWTDLALYHAWVTGAARDVLRGVFPPSIGPRHPILREHGERVLWAATSPAAVAEARALLEYLDDLERLIDLTHDAAAELALSGGPSAHTGTRTEGEVSPARAALWAAYRRLQEGGFPPNPTDPELAVLWMDVELYDDCVTGAASFVLQGKVPPSIPTREDTLRARGECILRAAQSPELAEETRALMEYVDDLARLIDLTQEAAANVPLSREEHNSPGAR